VDTLVQLAKLGSGEKVPPGEEQDQFKVALLGEQQKQQMEICPLEGTVRDLINQMASRR